MKIIEELLNDKATKPKDKTDLIAKWIIDQTISIDDLIAFAKVAKDSPKASCIEALEHASLSNPEITNAKTLEFVTQNLLHKAPRVKWESARVIGNIAHLYTDKLNDAICNLLTNTEDKGTVVRWSAAFALGQIIKLKTKHNKELLPAFEDIIAREEKNSIKKIYLDALKKVK